MEIGIFIQIIFYTFPCFLIVLGLGVVLPKPESKKAWIWRIVGLGIIFVGLIILIQIFRMDIPFLAKEPTVAINRF